jgi:hypothetical protein
LLEEMESLARRLEQQLTAYEKLHVDEMKRFQEQFAALQRIQADELQMLRHELEQIKTEIAAVIESMPESGVRDEEPSPPTLTRRDLLTGKMPPLNPGRK